MFVVYQNCGAPIVTQMDLLHLCNFAKVFGSCVGLQVANFGGAGQLVSTKNDSQVFTVYRSCRACLDVFLGLFMNPICSMYGIFTYIYPTNGPNVGKYTIHGASGNWYSGNERWIQLVSKETHASEFQPA